ncbi:MAG: hypothetical protein KJN63_02330 [Acidimicrobiia bacterium]|nr:hypothetical protein [Acidimicrobiia bacterium]
MTPTERAAELIVVHAKPVEVDEQNSILNYAESSRHGDWTLRSALVRLAQPQPLRSEAVLQLVRRLDAALKPVTRSLQRYGVCSRRSIPGGAQHVADIRLVDLAGDDEVLDAYRELVELDDAELAAVHLVRLALDVDELSDTLAAWAAAGPSDPPVVEIDRTCARVLKSMNDSGVPEEPRWDRTPGSRGRPRTSGRGV